MVLIAPEYPEADDVLALLAAHSAFANSHSAPQDVHVLDIAGLQKPTVRFFTARDDGDLLAVGAVKEIEPGHFELKSIHTAEAARGRGIGRAIVERLLDSAKADGATRISLETGSMEAMAPARTLYASLGFVECPPFADYWETESSVCMTLVLDQEKTA